MAQKIKFSIRARIIVTIVSVVILALASAAVVLGVQIHQALITQATGHLIRTVDQKATEYDLVFSRLQEEVEGVSDFAHTVLQQDEVPPTIDKPMMMPWVNEGTGVGFNNGYGSPELTEKLRDTMLKMERVGQMIESATLGNPYIELGYFASAEGLFVFDDDEAVETISALEAFEPAQRPWFRTAVRSRRTIWTAPYVDANTKNLIVTVASPVFGSGNRVLGVAGFDVLLTTIQQDILRLDIGYEGSAILVGRDGKALVREGIDRNDKRWDRSYETDNLIKTANTTFNRIVADMVNQQSGLGEYEAEDGRKYLAYAPVNAINASVGVIISENDVVRPAENMLKIVGIVALVIAAIAVLIGMVLGNSISKPIRQLTRAVDQISQGRGRLNTLPVQRSDEIGMLTDAFNRLITSLKIAMARRKRKG